MARGKWAVINSPDRLPGRIRGTHLSRDIAARIRVAQIDLQQRGRPQPSQRLIAPRKKLFGVLIVRERLLESRARQAVANAPSELAKIQALREWLRRTQEALKPAAQIRGAHQVRFGICFVRLDHHYGSVLRERAKKLRVASRVEFEFAIKRQHTARIL